MPSRSDSAPSGPAASFLIAPQPWTKDAACRGYPTSMFFDECEQRNMTERGRAIQECRSICSGCPVRWECATQALVEEDTAPHGRYGFRGCLSPRQRGKIYQDGGLRKRDPKNIPLH